MSTSTNKVIIIVALSENSRVIGKNGGLIWQIPEDIKRFKDLTSNHPVIMGRKTWESIPEKFRPLKSRTNIVITRNSDFVAIGAIKAESFKRALEIAVKSPGSGQIFVIGGAQIYAEALSITNELCLTIVKEDADGDVFFPEYKDLFSKVIFSEKHEEGPIPFLYETRTKQ